MQEAVTIQQISGYAVVTVWQKMSSRNEFTQQIAYRAGLTLAVLLVSIRVIAWFGIKLGLLPLLSLQKAIATRSPNVLRLINRPVPVAVARLVQALNQLFTQVSVAIASKDVFISDAAHQLRNTVAGLLSMAEATNAAKTDTDRKQRAKELITVTQRLSHLTQQMLAYQHAKSILDPQQFKRLNLCLIAKASCERKLKQIIQAKTNLEFLETDRPAWVLGKAILVEEAIENLLDNAIKHGGKIQKIVVRIERVARNYTLTVEDDGLGFPKVPVKKLFQRFYAAGNSPGSGLGLPIVQEIMQQHGGKVKINKPIESTSVALIFPKA